MVNRSVHYGMGPTAGSPLATWHARLRERPSVATTFSEFDAVAGRMGDMAAAYASGERRREYRDHRLEWMVKSGGIDVVRRSARQYHPFPVAGSGLTAQRFLRERRQRCCARYRRPRKKAAISAASTAGCSIAAK